MRSGRLHVQHLRGYGVDPAADKADFRAGFGQRLCQRQAALEVPRANGGRGINPDRHASDRSAGCQRKSDKNKWGFRPVPE